MNHSEAVKELAAERYLLDELSPGARDAFEEHMFDCPDCALDVRTGAIFIGEAKEQLPGLGSPAANIASGSRKESKQWFAWLRPAFAVPVMAALLVVVGYQNLVTLPALHNAADRPHVMQVVPLVGATRGGTHQTITADPANGISLPIDLSPDVAAGRSSFTFELTDPKGKSVSGKILPVNSDGAQSAGGDTQFSIVLPGHMLQNGAYMLVISGVDASGAWSPVARFAFDIALSK